MPDDAGFRVEAARAGAKVGAMARALGRRGLALVGAGIVLVLLVFWGVQWLTTPWYENPDVTNRFTSVRPLGKPPCEPSSPKRAP